MGIDGDSIDIVIVVVILYFILLPEYFGMRRNTPKPVNSIKTKFICCYYIITFFCSK